MRPFILNFAVPRKGESKNIYEYSFASSMNVIQSENGTINFIEANAYDISLVTKTKVKNEAEDDELHLLQLKTKTFVKQESDD